MSVKTAGLAIILILPALWAQEFDSHVVRNVMVPMRDGVRLSTDIYLPARGGKVVDGKFPVLVSRTPYSKAIFRNESGQVAQHGYVLVAQDCRGRFESEGEFYPFLNEGKDGYDAIEWAAAQPWSNGKVGTFGNSYLAWDQYHAAMYRPPHLVAMFAVVGGSDFYDEYGHPGGATNLGWPMWLVRSAQTSPQAAQKSEAAERLNEILKNPIDWLRQHPKERAAAFREFPSHEQAYRDLYENESKSAYWKQRGFYTNGYHKEMKDVPVLFITGWYDYFSKGSLENYIALSKMQKTTKKLVVGPWPHGIGRSECGDAFFGDSAAIDNRALMLDWFDHWMKGSGFRIVSSAPARLFRMGGGSGERTPSGKIDHGGVWLEAGGWPHPQARPMRLHIDSGRLTEAVPHEKGQATYVFDPDNPVPTVGGRYGGCVQDQVCSPQLRGCTNNLPLQDRPDVLSFVTEPLKNAMEVTGKVRARLWVSSDAKDTDFTAKLMDVYPNGYAMIIADGLIRTRFREGFEKPKLMKPGEIYEVSVDLGSTSNLFAAGHRIRLDISSSNYPQNEPNPNTGEPFNAWTRKLKARNTVYFDKARASHVELPVVPAAR